MANRQFIIKDCVGLLNNTVIGGASYTEGASARLHVKKGSSYSSSNLGNTSGLLVETSGSSSTVDALTIATGSRNILGVTESGTLSTVSGRFTSSLSAVTLSGTTGNFTTSLSAASLSASDGVTLTNTAGGVGLGTFDAVSATVTNGASGTIFTIPTSQYRSGKIVIQAVSVGIGSFPPTSMETSEILFIQGSDGYTTNVDWCEYATVGIGNTSIVTYIGVVVGDNVEFRATNNHSATINFVSSISQLYTVT
jgi:hypothetical protein